MVTLEEAPKYWPALLVQSLSVPVQGQLSLVWGAPAWLRWSARRSFFHQICGWLSASS